MFKKFLRNTNNKDILFTIALFLVFAFLAVLFPDTGDDWAWGSQIGMDRLLNKFDNYNGRWAGNLLVMLLTRSKFLDIVFTSFCLVCSCLLPKIFVGTKRFLPYVFGTFLFLLIPKQLLMQSVVWTAGLTNYIPPILLTFFYFLLVRNIFEEEVPSYHWSIGVIAAPVGFVGALFMENVTLYNIAISVAIMGFVFIKYKKVYLTHCSHLVGSIAGAVFMFSNSVYTSIANGTDSYRSTASDSGLIKTIGSHTNIIFQQFFQNNIAVLMVLSILCVVVYLAFARATHNKKLKRIALVSVAINLLSCIGISAKNYLCYWLFGLGKEETNTIAIAAFAGIAAVYCLSVLVTVLICVTQHKYKFKLLLLLASIPVLIAPLLVVNPIGPRCFFPPFFMLIAACVMLFSYILKVFRFPAKTSKQIGSAFLAGSTAILIFLFSIYIPIHTYDVKRNEYAHKQVDAGYKTIMMCKLPNETYVWMPNPMAKLWSQRYKLFHGIDDEIKFKFLDCEKYDQWIAEFDKEVTTK